jgi:transposase
MSQHELYLFEGLCKKPQYETRQKAKERQETEEFKKQYALRAGIEGTISQGIRGFGLRQCRYLGLAKSHLQHILTAASMNLLRVFNWLSNSPLAKTRSSPFYRLAYSNSVSK